MEGNNNNPNGIKNGDKVRVFAGDRDTVMFDPFGVVRNLDNETGKCEVQLGKGRGCYFVENTKYIGPLQDKTYNDGFDVALYDWKEDEQP